ncbi:response regulator [Azospirillum sp. SYSU D00513]|uniref:response regulator n=1 Tax=Azospirillum sp. SYSU D00513 TaxID=2812561 RepID=UPI001A964BE5|nr:response regulator [Azospirillum sp. SYSU D00513]
MSIHPERFTVLVAEDEAIIRASIVQALKEHGHAVIEAAGVGEALSLLAAGRRPDFALLDIRLAHQSDGIDLAHALRERWGILSIFVSGNLQGETLDRALRAGPLNIVRKPFGNDDLHRALELAAQALCTEDCTGETAA